MIHSYKNINVIFVSYFSFLLLTTFACYDLHFCQATIVFYGDIHILVITNYIIHSRACLSCMIILKVLFLMLFT